MAEGTPIDTRPDWLKGVQAEGTSVEVLLVDGQPYPFTVTRSGLAEGLPYTVGAKPIEALMISENVPSRWRPLILTHEVREVARFANLPDNERCPSVLLAELRDAESALGNDFVDYVESRSQFFNALVGFYQKDPRQLQSVSREFMEGLVASRDYLRGFRI